MLYINCSTNLQDDLATNIFIRHFSYVSFLFSHMPVFQSASCRIPGVVPRLILEKTVSIHGFPLH